MKPVGEPSGDRAILVLHWAVQGFVSSANHVSNLLPWEPHINIFLKLPFSLKGVFTESYCETRKSLQWPP